MTKFRLGTLGLLAVALFSLPNCGGNSDTGTNNSMGGSTGLPTGAAESFGRYWWRLCWWRWQFLSPTGGMTYPRLVGERQLE